MKDSQKKIVAVGAIGVILLIGGVLLFMRSGGNDQQIPGGTKQSVLTESEIIPTVDPSVTVTLTSENSGKDLLLTIDSIPEGTETIEYEMSYETAKQGLQGLIGMITVDSGSGNSVEKEVTAGTCSSGTCVYHDITSEVRVTLKFSGEYGDRIFEKPFSITQ